MTKGSRFLRTLTVASTCLLIGTFGLAVAALRLNPWDHAIALTADFRVGLFGGLPLGRIVFFDRGPYRGSILQIAMPDGAVVPDDLKLSAFDAPGVYWRRFHWDGEPVWTLMGSFAYPIIVFSLLPAASVVRHLRRRPVDRMSE